MIIANVHLTRRYLICQKYKNILVKRQKNKRSFVFSESMLDKWDPLLT